MERVAFHDLFTKKFSQDPLYRTREFNEICSIINALYDTSNGSSLNEEQINNILEEYKQKNKGL